MERPRWAKSKLPNPGEPGFSSKPGEDQLAVFLGGKRRPMSGAGEAPYDVASDEWLLDSKETSRGSYSLTRRALELLTARALKEGRRPMMTVTFWEGELRGETWVTVRLVDLGRS